MGIRKRQQQIYFRSLTLPPSAADIIDGVDSCSPTNSSSSHGETKPPSTSNSEYCPHFLAALQLTAHVLIPLRKALIHFYVSYRSKDVQKLEWLTLLAFGRLFRDLITASNGSSSNSVLSGGTSSSANTGSVTTNTNTNANSNDVDPSLLQPVSSERFFPVLYTCLLKHDLERWPKDATEAIGVLLDCLKCCSRTLPVTNQLWSALLDKACLGLIARQSLVGRRKQETSDQKEVLQRSHTEQVILWCPHVLPIGDTERIPMPTLTPTPTGGSKEKDTTNDETNANDDDDDDDEEQNVPTLLQLMEAEFRKRPLSTTSRKYYDFDKKSYDFEVEIPTKFLDEKEKILMKSNNNNDDGDDDGGDEEKWTTTRSMQFASLTGYLFLAIDRRQTQTPTPTVPPGNNASVDDENNKKQSKSKIDRSELSLPSILDLTKLCSKKNTNNKSSSSTTTMPQEAVYELVGGALYDEGEYIAVLKDFTAVAAAEEKKSNNNNNNNTDDNSDEEDEDETWKLMESEETIPMSESDVLEFLKGEGDDDDDDDNELDEDEEYGPCGTLAVYKLRSPPSSTTTTIFDEMNQLLSDIVISQVSGSLSSKTDFYIEEEVFEEEIIED